MPGDGIAPRENPLSTGANALPHGMGHVSTVLAGSRLGEPTGWPYAGARPPCGALSVARVTRRPTPQRRQPHGLPQAGLRGTPVHRMPMRSASEGDPVSASLLTPVARATLSGGNLKPEQPARVCRARGCGQPRGIRHIARLPAGDLRIAVECRHEVCASRRCGDQRPAQFFHRGARAPHGVISAACPITRSAQIGIVEHTR
jgi:hypothetical protein